jgi:hypothetical protein
VEGGGADGLIPRLHTHMKNRHLVLKVSTP